MYPEHLLFTLQGGKFEPDKVRAHYPGGRIFYRLTVSYTPYTSQRGDKGRGYEVFYVKCEFTNSIHLAYMLSYTYKGIQYRYHQHGKLKKT